MHSLGLEAPFTRFPNQLLEGFLRAHLSSRQLRVVLFVVRKTFGFHKESDLISMSQFSKELGIARRNVYGIVKDLEAKNILLSKGKPNKTKEYRIEIDPVKWKVEWRVSLEQTTVEGKGVMCGDDKVSSVETTEVSSAEMPTKEKEINIKEIKSNKKQWENFKDTLNRRFTHHSEMTEAGLQERKAQLRKQARRLLEGVSNGRDKTHT